MKWSIISSPSLFILRKKEVKIAYYSLKAFTTAPGTWKMLVLPLLAQQSLEWNHMTRIVKPNKWSWFFFPEKCNKLQFGRFYVLTYLSVYLFKKTYRGHLLLFVLDEDRAVLCSCSPTVPFPDVLAPFCPACLLFYKSISPSRGRRNKRWIC